MRACACTPRLASVGEVVFEKLRMTFRSILITFGLFTASVSGAELPASAGGVVTLGELNCTACHAASAQQAAWFSPKVVPALQDVGSRASAV